MAQKPDVQKIILEAHLRTATGKGPASSLRREGLIPGVIYGEGKSAVSVQIGAKELTKVLQTKSGARSLITLKLKESSTTALPERTVLIKELQHHPLSHLVTHVDFHQVSLTKQITVTVPLVFKGDSIGVKHAGGVLEHLRWDLEVECLPTQIPSVIEVDVAGLDVGKSLDAKAVPLPQGVRLVTDPNLPVVACEIPKEEVPAPAAEEAGAPAEPEVLKQKKPEEATAEEAGAKEKQSAPKDKEKA